MNTEHTNISDLTAALATKQDLPLKFYFDGSAINQGYHVTEVRHAAINSLDCGKNSPAEQWNEITVQLLDGSSQSTQGHMPSAKFLGIIGAALKSLAVDSAPYLFFEYAPGNGPIRKLSVASIEHSKDGIAVSLGSEKAICKPFQRSKAARAVLNLRTSALASSEGCCSGDSKSDGNACCA